MRLALLQQAGQFEYLKVLNDVGFFSLQVPLSFDRSLIRRDARIEFWRAYPGGALRLEQVGLLRRAQFATDAGGKTSIVLSGPDLNHLIKRRYVLYYAGASQAVAANEYADNLCKRLIRENHGSSATETARDWTSLGLSVAANTSSAQQVSLAFHYENVLAVCQEAAEASRQKGTALYFGVVPLSPASFEFQTKTGQWGYDRTLAGLQGTLAREFGNLAEPSLDLDWFDEVTHMTALGKGQGAAQQVRSAQDDGRLQASVWGRIEGVKNASGAEDSTTVTDAAKAGLEAARPHTRFRGRIVQTAGFVYGRDWDFGDRFTWQYEDQGGYGVARSLRVSVAGDGKESIEARLETEE